MMHIIYKHLKPFEEEQKRFIENSLKNSFPNLQFSCKKNIVFSNKKDSSKQLKQSCKKIIEVLNIDKNISFGSPIFKINNSLQNRFIIEYKENANATIKFNTKEKRILFSNLIPINDSFKGYYDYYVPDGSINAFNFIDEKFIFEENVKTIEKMNIPNKENIKKGLFPK